MAVSGLCTDLFPPQYFPPVINMPYKIQSWFPGLANLHVHWMPLSHHSFQTSFIISWKEYTHCMARIYVVLRKGFLICFLSPEHLVWHNSKIENHNHYKRQLRVNSSLCNSIPSGLMPYLYRIKRF